MHPPTQKTHILSTHINNSVPGIRDTRYAGVRDGTFRLRYPPHSPLCVHVHIFCAFVHTTWSTHKTDFHSVGKSTHVTIRYHASIFWQHGS